MRHLFYLLVLSGFSFFANAQHQLSGKIVNEADNDIPSATVQVLDADSNFVVGSVSDGEGRFTIPKLENGSYTLSISYIGYCKRFVGVEMPDEDYVLPPVVLREDNVALGDVTITGNSFIQKKDHLLVIPDKAQIKLSFSGYDLLYNLMIPGLTVDRKNKTVTSLAGGAALYINGVEADMREIQNLQPKDVERIEYYTMPTTGVFAGNAAAVNYITKVYKTGGYITLDGEQTIGYTKGDYNVASKVSHNNTSYTFFGGYNMKKYDGVKVEKNEDLLLRDYDIYRTTVNDNARYKGNQQYAQFKVSDNTKKRDLSASASFVRENTPHDDRNEILSYSGYENHTIRSFDGNGNENMKGAANLTGVFHVDDRQFWKVRLNGSYTKNRYDRVYSEGEQRSMSNANEDLYAFDVFLGYAYQPNARNSLYSRISHFHNISSSLYGGIILLGSIFGKGRLCSWWIIRIGLTRR